MYFPVFGHSVCNHNVEPSMHGNHLLKPSWDGVTLQLNVLNQMGLQRRTIGVTDHLPEARS